MRYLIFILPILMAMSCNEKSENSANKTFIQLKDPNWRAVLEVPGGDLPFNFQLFQENDKYRVEIKNGEEKLIINDVRIENDSIFIPGYIFDSEIQAKIVNGDHLEGYFVKFDTKSPYKIPFFAVNHEGYRFSNHPLSPKENLSGKWEVTFKKDTSETKAIGVFKQDGNYLEGTFLTSTGDYRFLEGEVDGDELLLSVFDGTHAFLFQAKIENNGSLKGNFWSGNHWHEEWTATRNENFELPDPSKLTYLKEVYNKFDFNFKNTNGEFVSSNDSAFKNKVLLVQILGTWCPNCMDETIFLTELKEKLPDVQVVGLAFEKTPVFEEATEKVEKMKTRLNVNYPVLIAGISDKISASEALPMLNKIMSYPTTIAIDKKGNVRNIHTGFTGPGTGDIYRKFKEEYIMMVNKLLEE